MIPDHVHVKHIRYGEGKVIEANCVSETEVRLFIQWKDGHILAGWYDCDDPNIEICQIT